MLVVIEYPIWELLSNVGIYRTSNMGITQYCVGIYTGITIACWYFHNLGKYLSLDSSVFYFFKQQKKF